MLFTWDTTNLCIVFRQWHVRSPTSLVFSLVAVVFLGVGYEALRSMSRRYEAALAKRVESMPRESLSLLSRDESSSFYILPPLLSVEEAAKACVRSC
jgi:solute carrier family 31 (copper transporter), member 1